MDGLLYMEVDLRKFAENLREIARISGRAVIPVIKSEAYGMGAKELGGIIEEMGIRLVAVADMNEALRLAREGFTFEILVMNGAREHEFKDVDDHPNVVLSLNSLHDAEKLSKHGFQRQVKLHLYIDTGMNRLGFSDFLEYSQALAMVSEKGFIPEGIYTHFTDSENAMKQIERFLPYAHHHPYRIIHAAASSAYSFIDFGTHVRVGADLYGQNLGRIRQILKIACKPLEIRRIKRGETVGYDRAYVAQEDEMIAILPIGYYNGFRRSLRGFPVYANKKRYPTVGKVCMNHLFVRVDEEVDCDTEFVITSEDLPVGEIAERLGTVPHEVLCMFRIDNIRYLK